MQALKAGAHFPTRPGSGDGSAAALGRAGWWVGEGLRGTVSALTKPAAVVRRAEAASLSSHQESLLPWIAIRADLGQHLV